MLPPIHAVLDQQQYLPTVADQSPPERAIIGFHRDEQDHWVADLECGHGRHVRHDPPWQNREWALSVETRRARIGQKLICKKCVDSPGD